MTTTWQGGFSGDYNFASNWSSGLPGSGIFDASGFTKTIVVGSSVSPQDWTFNGGDYMLTVTAAVLLEFQGAGVVVNGGSATIEALNNSQIIFGNQSDGGNARYKVDLGGQLDFSVTTGTLNNNHVSAGSIEGDGVIFLGPNQLTVGGNNLSTNFSGNIVGQPGSGLTKVGTGTLTLSGHNTFGGPITLNGGNLDIAGGTAVPDGIVFGAGPHTLRVESAALPANNFVPAINAFAQSDTIDLPNLPFVPGATATYNATFQTLAVIDGSTTTTFDSLTVAGTGTNFAVLSDHSGGSRVMLAIIESRPHKLVDATHSPPGQPSPTNGPDVIVALGANDTVNGLGGDDILVGGARGVRLIGGPGADTFLFQKVSASPPKHPDTIWDFKHAQGDKIDLYDLRAAVPGDVPLVFIGVKSFTDYHYHDHHKMVFGMVRYSHGLVEVNVNHNLAPDFAIRMHNAPPLHAGDFIL